MTISIDDFVALITSLYGEKQMQELEDKVRSILDNTISDLPMNTSSMLKNIVVGFAKGVLKDKVGEFTIEALFNSVDKIADVIKSKL